MSASNYRDYKQHRELALASSDTVVEAAARIHAKYPGMSLSEFCDAECYAVASQSVYDLSGAELPQSMYYKIVALGSVSLERDIKAWLKANPEALKELLA